MAGSLPVSDSGFISGERNFELVVAEAVEGVAANAHTTATLSKGKERAANFSTLFILSSSPILAFGDPARDCP